MSESFIQFLAFIYVLGLAFFGDHKSNVNKLSRLLISLCFGFWLVVNAATEVKETLGWWL